MDLEIKTIEIKLTDTYYARLKDIAVQVNMEIDFIVRTGDLALYAPNRIEEK